jgi:hypothetical protein
MPDKTYKIGQDIFDIPETEVDAFVKDNPNAIEIESFKVDKDTFDIPVNEIEGFLKEFPQAQSLKKKVPTEFVPPFENFRKFYSEGQKDFSVVPSQSKSNTPRTTTVAGDLLRTLKSTSLRALGGISGVARLGDKTIDNFVLKPILKSIEPNASDDDIQSALDVMALSSPGGTNLEALSKYGGEAQDRLTKVANRTDAKMKQIEGGIIENFKQGNIGDGFEQLGRGVVGTIPYLAEVALTAGAGTPTVLTAIGSTAASQQYGEIRGREDLSESQKLLNSWMYGGFEAAGELVTAGILNRTFKAVGASGKQLPKEAVDKLAIGIAKKFGLVAKEGTSEAGSEMFTQIGQNITAIMTGEDPNRSIFDGVLDAGLIALVPGAGMGAVQAAVSGRAIATQDEINKVNKSHAKQAIIIDQIEESETPAAKEALEGELARLKDEEYAIIDKNVEIAQKMTDEQRAEATKLQAAKTELQSKLDGGEITEEEIPTIEEAVKNIDKQIDDLRTTTESIKTEPTIAEKPQVETKVETLKEETQTITDEQINSFNYSIENILPDKDNKKYMDIAQNLDAETYNKIADKVHGILKDTHAYESDYLTSVGYIYDKIITQTETTKLKPKLEEETKDASKIGEQIEEGRRETTPVMEQGTQGSMDLRLTSQDRMETGKGEEITPTYFHATNKGDQIRTEGFIGKSDERSLAAGVKTEGVFLYPNDKEAATEFTKNLGEKAEVLETKINGKIYDANTETKYGWEQDKQITEVAKDIDIINKLKEDGYVGVTSTELGQPTTFVFNPESIELKPQPKQIATNLGIEYIGEQIMEGAEPMNSFNVEIGGQKHTIQVPQNATEEEVKQIRDAKIAQVEAAPSDIEATIREIEAVQKAEESTLREQEAKTEQPPPESPTKEPKPEEKEPEAFERKTLKRFRDDTNLSTKFKMWLSENGITTTRMPNDMTAQEADYVIASNGMEKASRMVKDLGNNMPESVRALVATRIAKLYDDLSNEALKEGDTETSDEYTDKAIRMADWLGTTATGWARGLQELNSVQVRAILSPRAQLIAAERDARTQRDTQIKENKKDIDSKSKKLKSINEETVASTLANKNVLNVKNKVLGKEKKPSIPKAKLAEEKKIRTKLWAELKIAREQAREQGKSMGFAATPIHAEEARIAGEITRSLIRSGYYKVQDIIDALKREWKEFLGEVIPDDYAERLIPKDIDGKPIEEALADNYIEKATKKLVTKIDKMLYDPKVKKDDPITQLVNTLFEKVKEKDTTEKKPVTKKPTIEKIREAIEDKKKYASVWESAKEEVTKRIESNPELSEDQIADYNQRLQAFYDEIIGKPYSDKQISDIVRGELRDMDVSIDEIIRQHYTVYDATRRTLQEKFVDELDLSEEDATLLADAVGREFDKIATAKKRSALLRGITPKESIEPKRTKDTWEKLIELSNLGAWSDAEFAEAYADKMGFPKLTEENKKEIERLSRRVQDAKEGFQKFAAIQDLLTYQSKLPGMDWGEVGMAMWYASILSGGRTQFKNAFANVMNTIFEFAVSMRKPQNLPILLGALAGHGHGLKMFKRIMATGYNPVKGGKVEGVGTLEMWKFKGGAWNPLNWPKYIPRLMTAVDAISYHGLKEMREWELALNMARQEDVKAQYPTLGTMARAMEILNRTKAREDAAIKQAEDEGLTGNSKKIRVWEIMEQSRPLSMVEEANNFALRGTFNHAPEGTLGALTDLVGTATQGVSMQIPIPFSGGKTATVRPLKFFIPFTRIISNVTNVALDYTPYGYVRAAKGGIGFKGYDKPEMTRKIGKGKYRKYSADERQRALTKAIIGTSSMALLYVLSAPRDDDDEPVVTITANGTGDFKTNVELSNATGWQPYSIKVGKRWYSYQYTPLFLALAPVGYLRDAEKYQKSDIEGMEFQHKLQFLLMQTSRAMMDMSWMASLTGLLEALSAKNLGSFDNFWQKMGVSMAKSAIYPKLIEQVVQSYDKVMDIPRKDSNTFWGKVLRDVPVARNAYNTMLNAVGEPVQYDPVMMTDYETLDPFWKFIVDNNAFIGKPSQKQLKVYDDINKIERLLDDDEYYEYIRLSGSAIKERIENEVMGKNMPMEDVKEEVSKIKAEERARTKIEMFGWGDFRTNHPEEWLIIRDGMALQLPRKYKEAWIGGEKRMLTPDELKKLNEMAMVEYARDIVPYLETLDQSQRIPIENHPEGLSQFDIYIKKVWEGSVAVSLANLVYEIESKNPKTE